MKNWQLERRDLLKKLGVGAACLPLLRAGKAKAAGVNKRLIVFQMSEGYRQQYWKPNTGSLTTQMLPPTLQPLDAHKDSLIVLPDMSNPGIGAGGHGSYGVIYFGKGATGSGYKEPSGPTFDQLAAPVLSKGSSGRKSIHFWVQLHLPPQPTSQPGGTHCFWTDKGAPINPIGDPYVAYKEIFAGGAFTSTTDPAQVKRLLANKKSILDFVGSNLEEFKRRLGTDDKMAIEAHFGAIREFETQLQGQATNTNGNCATAPAMLDINDRAQYPNIQKAHMAAMQAALKCGVTNVATIQHGDSSGNSINFGAFVPGLPALSKNNYKSPWRNWHDLGHSPIQDGVDHKKIVDGWFMTRFAEFVTQMKAIPDVDGTLFDNTCIVIGNHMQEGANHDAQKNPMMVIAGKNIGLATGQCVASAGKGVGMLYSDVLTALGVQNHGYGAGIGILKA
jgi:Protein of unknown function (DUF1552)